MKFCKHRVMDRCRKKGRPCTFSKECFEAEEDRETNIRYTHIDSLRHVSNPHS